MPINETGTVYKNILDNIPGNAVFVYNKNLQLLVKGGEILNEFSSEKESNLYDFLYQSNFKDLLYQIEEALLGKKIIVEQELNSKTFRIHLKPIFNSSNEVFALILIFQDITNTQLLQALENKLDELKNSNADLEQFAFIASHDLQEPLRKIKAFSDRLIVYNTSLPPDAKSYISRIVTTVQRMQKLVDDLLFYAEINNDKVYKPIKLSEIIQDVLEELDYSSEEFNAQFEVNVQHTVNGNKSQLKQLFRNLLTNSLKYSKPTVQPFIQINSEVCTSCEAEAVEQELLPDTEYCKIVITDNGIGFDKKVSKDLFNLFYRVRQNKDIEGSGIGLAVCKKIAANHQGFISAKSEEGQGAEFTVYLPLNK